MNHGCQDFLPWQTAERPVLASLLPPHRFVTKVNPLKPAKARFFSQTCWARVGGGGQDDGGLMRFGGGGGWGPALPHQTRAVGLECDPPFCQLAKLAGHGKIPVAA